MLEIKEGDFAYNTTRNALTKVQSVSANIVVTTVASQTAGDTVIFHKKAMPIANWFHVHYGRGYYIDARDTTKIRVSGPQDPQDMTTEARTLQASTIDYGTRYGRGAGLKTLSTYGRYLVGAGLGQVFVDSGQDPISDTSTKAIDLTPVGSFTQGGGCNTCYYSVRKGDYASSTASENTLPGPDKYMYSVTGGTTVAAMSVTNNNISNWHKWDYGSNGGAVYVTFGYGQFLSTHTYASNMNDMLFMAMQEEGLVATTVTYTSSISNSQTNQISTARGVTPVSYTHLTLPTNREV